MKPLLLSISNDYIQLFNASRILYRRSHHYDLFMSSVIIARQYDYDWENDWCRVHWCCTEI